MTRILSLGLLMSAARLSRARLAALIKAAGGGTLPGDVERLRGIFRAAQLRQPPAVETAMGHAAAALVATLTACDLAVRDLEKKLEHAVAAHPDAPILDTLPAFGTVLAGRILAECGDDPARFPDVAARRAYAGTSPVTRASGKSRAVVMRRGGNRRLVDACRTWAFATLVRSPGARAYDRRRPARDRAAQPREQAHRPARPLPAPPRSLGRDHGLVIRPSTRPRPERSRRQHSWWSGRARRAGTACPRLLTARPGRGPRVKIRPKAGRAAARTRS